MNLNVALAQIDIAFGQPEANMAALRPLAATAAARGAAVLVLPELWSTGYDLTRAHELAAHPGSGTHAALAALAREQGITLIGSTLTHAPDAPAGSRPTNTATVYTPDGSLAARYDKLHLFAWMDEDAFLAPGHTLGVLHAAWGPSALAICYDLRFPELFRSYALHGAQVVFLPAEWPQPRIAHWRTLVQARAIENQCYIVAVNRVGSDPTTTFGGHSLVVDPWGTILAEGGSEAELLFATLDLSAVAATRARMRVLHDRRPELYALAETPALEV